MIAEYFSKRDELIDFRAQPLDELLATRTLIDEVLKELRTLRSFAELGNGERGTEVALYLVKRCCARTLSGMVDHFGIGHYWTVSWNCRAIESRMAKEETLRDRIENTVASIS